MIVYSYPTLQEVYYILYSMNKYQIKEITKPKTIQEKTESFFKTVQAGDMVLFDILEHSIAVFGYTRAGKTTSCHLLCRSPLRAQNKNGELIYVPSTKKFDTAIVGVTHESETQIPNIFDTMVRDGTGLKNLYVLDQPGYGDTYGFHRIFSNGYFHYRTFSKTPKLKFVLAIWMNDLRGTAEKFKFTIRNFINTFNNWDKVKKDVLKATAILITKAQAQTTENSLIDIITNLREAVSNMGTNQKARYQEFVDDMVKQKKIFFIPKPTQINQKTEDNTTLQKIYDKTQFWERQLVSKNLVDMSQIKFSVSTQILTKLRDKDDEHFRQQFQHYMKYTQQRVDGMILNHQGSLSNIVHLLEKDAQGGNQSHQFLKAMQKFNESYYNFFQNYSKKRENIIANLFKNAENDQANQSTESQMKEMKSIYFIKKFKVLEFLFEFNQTIQDDMDFLHDRSIQKLENYSSNFLTIFKKFSILGINKNDRENIIYKYNYIVQRLIEESKILTLILFPKESIRQEFERLELNIGEDIFRMLFDRFFTQVLGQIKLDQLKLEFIQNIDFSNLVSPSEEIITFLESIPLKSKETEFKIAEFIIEYEKSLFKDEGNPQNERKKYVLYKLFTYRNKFFAFWQNLKTAGSVQLRQKCSETIINLTKSLAKVLQHMNMYNQAREAYRTINDAESIFKIYESQAAQYHKDPSIHRQILIKYANEANIYYRKQLTIQCCQKAFSLCSNTTEYKEISTMIVNFCTEKKQDVADDPYLSRLFNFQQKFFEDFSNELKAIIELECGL